jgi:hypothetical protein
MAKKHTLLSFIAAANAPPNDTLSDHISWCKTSTLGNYKTHLLCLIYCCKKCQNTLSLSYIATATNQHLCFQTLVLHYLVSLFYFCCEKWSQISSHMSSCTNGTIAKKKKKKRSQHLYSRYNYKHKIKKHSINLDSAKRLITEIN